MPSVSTEPSSQVGLACHLSLFVSSAVFLRLSVLYFEANRPHSLPFVSSAAAIDESVGLPVAHLTAL